jgi:diaminohydroxyphosphoribosylaminopyrimidine deaminase/5-amino-6-(5-phosphoribosylamino)uracil reductase
VGVSPSCANLLVDSGIKKVVVATIDPHMKVSGKGVKILEQAGIEVSIGDGKAKAKKINEGFFTKIGKKRPFITLKLATTSNAKIADKKGDSKWITNAKTREYAHLLRSKNDAILIGSGTALKDNPTLNCRLSGMYANSPTRIIMDRNLNISTSSNIFKTAKDIPTYIVSYKNKKINTLPRYNIKSIIIDENESLKDILKKIANIGITRILIEGGSHIASSFINANLVDRIIWMQSDKAFSDDGVDAIAGHDLTQICENEPFKLDKEFNIENDLIREYERKYNI